MSSCSSSDGEDQVSVRRVRSSTTRRFSKDRSGAVGHYLVTSDEDGPASSSGSPKMTRQRRKRQQHVRSNSFVYPLVDQARTSGIAVYQHSVDMARNTISEIDLPASSWCGFFACAMLAVTLGEVVKVNNAQPTPYMDEVFHVRQAQHYCAGNWSVWDSKITTLPGLYVLSSGIAHIFSYVSSKHPESSYWCTVEKLRFINLVMSVAMIPLGVDMARNTISEIDLPASSWCGFFACAMLAVTLGEVVKVNNAQPTPYMDEVFHVRQAQHYCAGNWSVWDSKITTLPGLYVLSSGIAHIFSYVSSKHPESSYWCTVEKLRFINLVMSVAIFLVMYMIFRKLSRRLMDEPGLGIQPIHRTCCMMNSLVLTCFPLLYFYNLLYYTDVGSVLFVLASYSCSIRNCHKRSAVLGAIAVTFRQTNIIWVGFTAGTVVIRDIEFRGIFNDCDDFMSQFAIAFQAILRNFTRYLKLLTPYILVIVGFAGFILYNKGIVVGDRSAHVAVLHFPQFLYFLLFLFFFSAPHMVQRLRYSHLTVLRYCFRPVHVALFFASALLAVACFRYEHPYLLADNRHYTFYVWRRILNRTPATMYLLLPVCFYTFLNMVALLSTVHSKFFTLLYFLCCAAQTVPQGLLEFRYFILPYILYRLHVPQHSWVVLFLELCQYTLINLLTVKDEPGLGIQPIHRTCCMMNSLVLTCFPLLYFYNLLYYTDVGSVLFVLASYSCSIRNCHKRSAVLGAIAVIFRQTNIIWVGFTAGTVVIRDIEFRGIFNDCDDFMSQFAIAFQAILRNFTRYLKLLTPYILIIFGFAGFILYNKGIVVGDRSAHVAVLHFPQFLYFLLFIFFFSAPHMVQRLRYSHLTVLRYCFRPVHVALFFASALLAVACFRYEHPYLLADNRHYTFYVWRRILNRTPATMYLLLPVCFYTFLNMVALLSTVHSKFFTLLYFLCCAAQTVPQGLLEFRYFILPYILYRLHVPQHSWVVLFLELCQYTLINLLTVKVFLNKTFDWPDVGELNLNPQRFMW
eukprot:sb/3461561/